MVAVTRTVLLLAGGLSALYLLWLVIYQTAPEMDPMPEPEELFGAGGVALMIAAPVSWLVAGAVLARVRTARGQLTAAAVLVAPFAAVAVARLVAEVPLLLVCLPSTAIALWGVRAWQRHRRLPAGLSLAALGWGGLVAISVAGGMNVLFLVYTRLWQTEARADARTELLRSGGFDLEELVDRELAIEQTVRVLNMLHAGVVEELAKGAGIAILYLLARRWFDSVLSGMVVGASVGLGFNLAESVEYMAQGAPEFQYWARQSVMLFGAHTVFSALAGAGFGIARQVADPRRRRVVVVLGFLMAMSGHVVYNAVGPAFMGLLERFGFSDTALAVAGPPLTMVVLQGPYLVICVLLLRRGVREQTGGLSRELFAEAGSPHGAVTEAEVPVLLNPLRRLLFRVFAARRRGGLATYRYLGRLHAAQLDLAMWRWHRRRGEADADGPGESALRDRVLAIRSAPPLVPDSGEKVLS